MADHLSPSKESTILEAARKRFAYFGFSKVTMDEIAGDVGLGKASLYYYFPTKEKLFEAVIVQEQNQFILEIRSILQTGKSAQEKLRGYAERRLLLFRNLLNLGNLAFQKFSEVKALFANLFANFEKEELQLLQEIIQLGQRSGEFAVTSPEQTAEAILHALHGLRLRFLRTAEGQRLDDNGYTALNNEIDLLVDLILRGLLSGRNSA